MFPALTTLTGGGGLSAEGGGPSDARTYGGTSSFDASGWNVNFGDGSIDSKRNGGGIAEYAPYIVAGLGLLLLWRMYRKR